jgi:hypothetical protein
MPFHLQKRPSTSEEIQVRHKKGGSAVASSLPFLLRPPLRALHAPNSFERDRTLRGIESRRLVLLLRLLRLWEVLAQLTEFCLGGVFDPNVTSDDREREL